MKSTNTIGFVLPAYNEGPVIGKVIDGLPQKIKIKAHRYDVKIIVVNDASTDNTRQIVTKQSQVLLINHLLNSGAGAATRTGINFAKQIGCNFIVTMDSDGQHTSNDAIRVVTEVIEKNADFVIGSRLLNSAGMPWYRVIGNKILSLITFLLFGVFVADSQSGLKAMNAEAASKIIYRSNSFAFSSEMIWKAHQAKLKIKEVPIQAIYTDYSLAKGQKNWDSFYLISQLVKRRLY